MAEQDPQNFKDQAVYRHWSETTQHASQDINVYGSVPAAAVGHILARYEAPDGDECIGNRN
jgi:hypothetical protein